MSKSKRSIGFTLIELVMVLVILSIIGITVAPRFSDNAVFQARGFADQVLATLRYAQKTAIAQHQNVCVTLSATTVTLTIDATCSTDLNLPDRQNNILTAPTDVTLSPAPITLIFDALGRATAATITVSGVALPITVVAETGYVYQ
jgi:MSHA pilin protein MshC